MSYMSLGAVSFSAAQSAALNRVLPMVRANRQFFSRLIVKWLDNNRGIPGVFGGEAGVKSGGKKGTTVNGKYVDLSNIYGAMRQTSKQKDARYDVQRAAALAVMAKRDMAHLAGSAVSVVTGIGAVSDASASVSISDSAATLPTDSSAAAEGFDWGAAFTSLLAIFPAIIDGIGKLLSFLPEEQATNKVSATPPTSAPSGSSVIIAPARSPVRTSAPKSEFPVFPALAAAGLLAFLVLRK